jgi:predicted DNA-binding transcriptional regulator YafY
MLASRLLSMLLLLQARRQMTAPELAREFEISVRTVYRDIDQLSAAGIPIYADRGHGGGIRLRDGFRTRLTGMTRPEAQALFLAGLPGPAEELGLANLLTAARLKLIAALPDEAQSGHLTTRFHLDPVGWFRASEPAPLLPEIARAVWNDRMLKMRYRRGGQTDMRVLAPLGLVLKGGAWYLVAQKNNAFRTYRAMHICEAEVLEERFARPKGFELAEHWTRSLREFEIGTYRVRAKVRVSPRGWSMLEWLGPYVVDAAARTASPPDEQGWIRCVVPVESVESGVLDLLRLGEEVEVLAPAGLRAQMVRRLKTMTALYADLP